MNKMTDTSILMVGYGGYVKIKHKDTINDTIIACQVTSASINRTYNIPTVVPFYQPFVETDNTAKSIIRAGYGTCSFSGEISCQLTEPLLNLLFQANLSNEDEDEDEDKYKYTGFFQKNAKFTLEIFDGMTVGETHQSVQINNCMWQSINIQCQPSSLVSVSISFQSDNEGQENFKQIDKIENNLYDETKNKLIPYWQTGSDGMLQFNMTFERNVTPVYLNNNKIGPSFLRPGLISASLNATYYDVNEIKNNIEYLSIIIGHKQITFRSAALQQSDFKMSNFQDIGEKTCQWKSMPLEYTKPIFTITNLSD